jgi:mono/diheme cytochrome c family protein
MPRPAETSAPRPGFGHRTRKLAFALLALIPFAGCFAEPRHESAATGVASSTSTGGKPETSSGGGKHARGGASNSQGGSAPTAGNEGPPEFGGIPNSAGEPSTGTGDVTGAPTPISFKCHIATAQPLPARKAVTSTDAPPPVDSGPQVLTFTRAQLFQTFQQSCGNKSDCHVGSGGNPNAQPPEAFKVTLDTFDQRKTLGDEAVEHVTSSDSNTWMPPDQGDGSKRAAGNPYYDLADELKQWQHLNFPDTLKITVAPPPTPPTPVTDVRPYLLSPDLGNRLTNIGSCIPENLTILDPIADEMDKKDALFASLETSDDLPPTIFDTDLVTLDSTELAKRRIFSYAPTYPLYSDHAGKMRYVRVPAGESIHYDAKLHDFIIPDNTRFYKTFLKPVKDKDGNVGYRKMETRLIVVRQDTQNADGSYTTHALRASYAWDKDEQMARRVTDPLRSGAAAADRLCPYVVDETVTRDPQKNPILTPVDKYCEYMTADEVNDPTSGQIRHYAIPSTDRCDQCHMGSSSHSFILGFTPWQVDRRAKGDGGIYEDPNDDEVTQLQRFLDYGFIDGIEPGQVKLEESQLIATPPRSPRNDYELKAQGYMLGNCAFCHNPHGFPVVTNPVLKEFELFPSPTGGIFQFPLNKFSPRAKAGLSQGILIPYITTAWDNVTGGVTKSSFLPVENETVYPVVDGNQVDLADYSHSRLTLLAPWRSLIWRNVYTPFTYTENSTLYIHMPRNAAGYDCRAHQIMANWMLSIPTVANISTNLDELAGQPVMEVSATDPSQAFAYAQAKLQGQQRIEQYATGLSGAWCPNDDDLVDPQVLLSKDPTTGLYTQPSPVDEGLPITPRVNPNYEFPPGIGDNVPDHAHWISTDTSDATNKWVPRRANWKNYLVTRDAQVSADLSTVIDDLQKVNLSPDFEQFALQEVPLGIWAPACSNEPVVKAAPTVAQLEANPSAPIQRWLAGGVKAQDSPRSPDEHVHEQSRGEAVFHAICQNCHGPNVDSKSPLAATILEITGGETRVANFRDGLFGPRSAPGAFAHDEFLLGDGTPSEDWQVRYVLFMGLGGTGANIPLSVLNLVATSPFYGFGVAVPGANSPNMLGSAQQICFYVLESARYLQRTVPTIGLHEDTWIANTGHYELWESLCSFGNDPVVRVFDPTKGDNPTMDVGSVYRAKDDLGAWIYPQNAPVGNQRGETRTGIEDSNTMPWCVLASTDAQRSAAATWAAGVGVSLDQVPFCPETLFAKAFGVETYNLALDQSQRSADPAVPLGNQDFTKHWLRHGAMNAGISAFYFMRGFTNGSVTPNQPFNFCQ